MKEIDAAYDQLADFAYQKVKRQIIDLCDELKLDFYSLYFTRFLTRGSSIHSNEESTGERQSELIELVHWYDRLFGFPECKYENRRWFPKEPTANTTIEVVGKIIYFAKTLTDKQEDRLQAKLEEQLPTIGCSLQSMSLADGARLGYHLEIVGDAPDGIITELVNQIATDLKLRKKK